MWRISGMVAFLFELHDVAAEPFFHSFYSCDASGSVDIVGWKYHTWQGNLFGLCHTIGWSQSQVWGSLTSHLWTGEGKLSSHKVFSEENIEGQSSWQIWPVLVIWNVRFIFRLTPGAKKQREQNEKKKWKFSFEENLCEWRIQNPWITKKSNPLPPKIDILSFCFSLKL